MGDKALATVDQNRFAQDSGQLQPGGQPLAYTALGTLLLRGQQHTCLADRPLNQL